MDVFDVAAVTHEMKELEGSYIDKVYQDGDEIFIKIKGFKKEIFIKSGKWVFLSEHRERKEEHPPSFAMALRKYIGNGRIRRIEQYDFDRIIIIEIYRGEKYFLILEVIPNGNVVLADEEYRIINLMKHQRWAHRILKRGEKYIFPPSKYDPERMGMEEFIGEMKKGRDVVRGLVSMGFPGVWAEEICLMAGVEKNIAVENISHEEMEELYNSSKKLLEKIREGKYNPVIVEKDGEYENVLPFPSMRYNEEKKKFFDSMNEAVEEYFFKNFVEGKGREEKVEDEERERIKRQIIQQKEAIKKFMEEEEKYRKQGDAIFANYELVEKIIKGEGKPKKEKYPVVWIDLPFEGGIMEVDIDIRKSVNENAGEKYEMSKKLRDKIEGAKKALEESIKKMEKAGEEKKERVKRGKRKKFWFQTYRWFISSEGNLIIGGKDAKTNERIVKKYMKDDDIYVHADVHGAPSCIVKAEDVEGKKREIGDESIKEACQFAASYSRAWKQFSMADSYWVYPWQVSKRSEAGEYLPQGAFVIRGKRNYMRSILKIGIGIVKIKGEEVVMGGAPSAVKKHSEKWIIMIPGEKDKNEVAKKIASLFNCSVEEIMHVMPPGNVEIEEEKT